MEVVAEYIFSEMKVKPEIKKSIQVIATKVEPTDNSSRVERFSTWTSLFRAFGILVKASKSFKLRNEGIQYQVKTAQSADKDNLNGNHCSRLCSELSANRLCLVLKVLHIHYQ